MPPEDIVRIRHMIDMARAAADIAASRTAADIEADMTAKLALERALEVLGEAASKVSAETCAGSPDIPWREIIGMRNRLVHAYFDLDPEIIWKTATDSAQQILPALEALLARD